MKTVYSATINFLQPTLEGVKLKYKVLPGSNASKDRSRRTYPALEVESLLFDGRDIRFMFSQKELDKMALDDYMKTEQGESNG